MGHYTQSKLNLLMLRIISILTLIKKSNDEDPKLKVGHTLEYQNSKTFLETFFLLSKLF